MENEIIGKKLFNFIIYLNEIGLLPEGDNKIFQNYFQTKEKTDYDLDEKYIEENIINALNSFLNSLSEEKNKEISLNIYKKYILEKQNLLSQKGKILWALYKKLKIEIFLKKWFIISINNKSSNKQYKNELEEANNNTISFNISKIQNKNKYSINNNSYNSSYNFSPKNKTHSNQELKDLKHNTRNHEYSLNILNLGEKLIESKSNQNKTSTKIIYNDKSYTFTNDYNSEHTEHKFYTLEIEKANNPKFILTM